MNILLICDWLSVYACYNKFQTKLINRKLQIARVRWKFNSNRKKIKIKWELVRNVPQQQQQQEKNTKSKKKQLIKNNQQKIRANSWADIVFREVFACWIRIDHRNLCRKYRDFTKQKPVVFEIRYDRFGSGVSKVVRKTVNFSCDISINPTDIKLFTLNGTEN